MSNRLLWPDYVKAFAIFLTVLGHSNVSPVIHTFIFSFHMPVFFIISGFFDRGEPLTCLLVTKNVKRFLFPYLFFSLISIPICWVSPYLHPELYPGQDSFAKIFLSAFEGIFLFEDKIRQFSFLPCPPLWFLVALFWIKLFFSASITLVQKKSYFMLLIVLICIVVCAFVPEYINYLSFHSAFLAFPYYCIGYILKKSQFVEHLREKLSVAIILSVVGALILFYLSTVNGEVNINGCSFGNYWFLFYFNGLIGASILIFMFSQIDKKIQWLQSIGESSLTILGSHVYPCIFIKTVIVITFSYETTSFPFWCSITIAGIACFIGPIFHHFLLSINPLFLGK